MSYPVAVLAVAAYRAKEVAALVDAARVLTFLAKARSRERNAAPHRVPREHVASIYHTASRLASYGRELAAETDRLLTAAERAQPERVEVSGTLDDDIETLRALLVASMSEAVAAIDMLETIQELGAEELEVAPLGTAVVAGQRQAVAQLLDGLRRRR